MELKKQLNCIKVGIILDSTEVPKWIERIISKIMESDYLELSIMISNRHKPPSTLRKNYKHFLYDQYCKFDYKYYSSKIKENAFEKVSLQRYLEKGINVGRINTTDPSQLNKKLLLKKDLHVIVLFGDSNVAKELIGLAKHGVWFFPFDSFGQGYIAEPRFFKSMFDKNIPLVTSLNTLLGKENSRVLYQSQSPVIKESLFLNSNESYWKSADFLLRELRNLHKGRENKLREPNAVIPETLKEEETPKNLETLSYLLNLTLGKIKSRMFYEQWFLAFRRKEGQQGKYTVIKPPSDRFYADPFIISKNNKHYVFFEEYIYSKGRGDISVLEIDPKNNHVSKPASVLEKPYHLSYPFLYEWENEVYMIPETSGNRAIELYRAESFPYKWELVKVLIHDINAVDATVINYNNKFWMFTNVFVEGSSSLDELFIFHSDSLVGDWIPHEMNPVVSNASSARPAGNIFLKDGKLIRPSQDCSFGYGYSVKFNEIIELTETSYMERTVDELKPDWLKNNKGTHTYNFNEEYEVIDGRSLELRR
jgi:hypothetical protein